MEKQIDIHIFGMDDKLFKELFPKEQYLIEEKDIGKIENRKKKFWDWESLGRLQFFDS